MLPDFRRCGPCHAENGLTACCIRCEISCGRTRLPSLSRAAAWPVDHFRPPALASNRVQGRRFLTDERFPFTPFPRGWYRVADSTRLPRGRIVPLRAFGRELVLLRGGDGAPLLFDAHCPHLGTHLGYGGRVVDGVIECPFHGWRFDAHGQCVFVPRARAIPPRARLQPWHVRDINGVVMAWFDASDGAPAWGIPDVPERSSRDWTAFHPAKQWTIATHVQEIVENGMDLAHFPHVHHQQTAGAESRGIEIDGPTLTHRTVQHHNIFGIGKRLGWHVSGTLDITCHALGCVVNRARIRDGISLDYCVVFYFLPIDGERVAVHSYYSIRRKGIWTRPLLHMAMRDGSYTIDQDVPIWENKLYRPRPLLSDADGPILQFRKWAAQFHAPAAAGNGAPTAPLVTVPVDG